MSEDDSVRLDKWLWAARFYKTRSLATEAISGGKIRFNGARVKPSKKVTIGAELEISKGSVEFVVIVLAIADKRGSARIAQTLYEETEDSIKQREVQQALRKNAMATIHTEGKPNKKDRRLIHRFKSKQQG
ncbi:MAG TPA: hypothetical protein ENK06_02900 [Gammaproteobacteria bacterium]|nr:hypothetical protein [Gammaproteobacteria bacterium]